MSISLKEYKELKKAVDVYNAAYRNGEPLISDEEYDSLLAKLEEFEEQNNTSSTTTSNVGDTINKSRVLVKHPTKMYSLKKEVDINSFIDRLSKNVRDMDILEFIVEPKYDGVAINLVYENKLLNDAILRGETGLEGNSILKSILYIKNVVKQLPSVSMHLDTISKDTLEIRGEVVLTNDDFNIVNDIRIMNNIKPFSNSRNAVAGILNRINNDNVSLNELEQNELSLLTFKPYGLVLKDNSNSKFLSTNLSILKKFGFIGITYRVHYVVNKYFSNPTANANGSIYPDNISNLFYNRDEIDCAIDGNTIKLNNITWHQIFTSSAKYQSFACCIKFPPKGEESQIISISYGLSKRGKLTPIANVNSVTIDGVNISKVNLYNIRNVIDKDYRLEDYVTVFRAGDVIPKLSPPIVEKRKDNNKYIIPDKCPYCNGEIRQEEVDLFCISKECYSVNGK